MVEIAGSIDSSLVAGSRTLQMSWLRMCLVLHLLLATKLLPDMEEAEEKLLEEEGLGGDEAQIEDLYARLSKQLDDHNEILQLLTVKTDIQDSGLLDPKVSRKMVRRSAH